MNNSNDGFLLVNTALETLRKARKLEEFKGAFFQFYREYTDPEMYSDIFVKCVRNGQLEFVEFLFTQLKYVLYPPDLVRAMESGHLPTAIWITENMKNLESFSCGLYYAVKSRNLDMIKWVYTTFEKQDYRTAISYCIKEGYLHFAKLLYSLGRQDDSAYLFALAAVSARYVDIALYFFEQGDEEEKLLKELLDTDKFSLQNRQRLLPHREELEKVQFVDVKSDVYKAK